MADTFSSTIKINLPLVMQQNIQSEASKIGMSLQDFIRMLVGTYFAKSDSIMAVTNEQALLNQAQKEIKAKKYTSVRSSQELAKYLSKF